MTHPRSRARTWPKPHRSPRRTRDRVRVIREGVASYLPDIDPEETTEWLNRSTDCWIGRDPARAVT